jgi:hypothetical protein
MARTRRNGWKAVTGSDADNRGIKHHADNDWFSKKNSCRGTSDDSWDEYWGRDRKMSYHIKQHWNINRIWFEETYGTERWDYDFIFDKEYEATAFMIGFL